MIRTATPQIELRHLHRVFDQTHAVNDVSFEVYAGEVFGYIGPNGAGKTTSMRILATLDEPTAGDAFVDGFSVVDDPDRVRRRLGFMPDYFGTYQNVNVREYLDFFARAYGLRGQRAARGDRRRDGVHAARYAGRQADRRLSKGMKQRLCLGRTMIHDPSVLVLDEPAAGLDPRARIELREMIAQLAAAGKAILISSHILTELAEICDRVGIIEQGRLLAVGSVAEISAGVQVRSTVHVRVLRRRRAAARLAGGARRRCRTVQSTATLAVVQPRRRSRVGGRPAAGDRRGRLSGRRIRREAQEPGRRVPARHGGPRAMSSDAIEPPSDSSPQRTGFDADVALEPIRRRRGRAARVGADRAVARARRRLAQSDPGQGNAAGAQELAVHDDVRAGAGGLLGRDDRRRRADRAEHLLRGRRRHAAVRGTTSILAFPLVVVVPYCGVSLAGRRARRQHVRPAFDHDAQAAADHQRQAGQLDRADGRVLLGHHALPGVHVSAARRRRADDRRAAGRTRSSARWACR